MKTLQIKNYTNCFLIKKKTIKIEFFPAFANRYFLFLDLTCQLSVSEIYYFDQILTVKINIQKFISKFDQKKTMACKRSNINIVI